MNRFSGFQLALVVLACSTGNSAEGFSISPQSFILHHSFGRVQEICSASALHMTILSYGGKKKDFKAGSPLSKAVAQFGIKPNYSCKKGDCATCEIFLGGRVTKPCVAKVPAEPKLKSLQENGLEIRI